MTEETAPVLVPAGPKGKLKTIKQGSGCSTCHGTGRVAFGGVAPDVELKPRVNWRKRKKKSSNAKGERV